MVSFDGENRRAAEGDRNRDGLSQHIEVHLSRSAREIHLLQHLSHRQLCAVQNRRPVPQLHLLGGILHAAHFHLDHRGAVHLSGQADEASIFDAEQGEI